MLDEEHSLRRRRDHMIADSESNLFDITFLKSSIKAAKNKPSLLLKRKLRWILLQDFLQLQQNAKKYLKNVNVDSQAEERLIKI